MCKRPEIVVRDNRSASYRYDDTKVETYIHGFTAESDEQAAIAKAPKGATFIGWHLYYWCNNCERSATLCPICKVRRCDNDIIWSMVGHFQLACKTCRPHGVKQSFEMGMDGVYAAGNRLIVEDPDIEGFTLTATTT